MTRKKIHIDELFRNGLKNLSLFVSNKDMEAIDDKKNVFNDNASDPKSSPFSNFEIEITENDWLATKAKLDVEKAVMAQDNIFSKGFESFEIQPSPDDWSITYQKYLDRKKRKTVFLWMGTGVILLVLALTAILTNLTWNKENVNIALDNNQTLNSENSNSANSETKGNVNQSNSETALNSENLLPSETHSQNAIEHKHKAADNSKVNTDSKPSNNKTQPIKSARRFETGTNVHIPVIENKYAEVKVNEPIQNAKSELANEDKTSTTNSNESSSKNVETDSKNVVAPLSDINSKTSETNPIVLNPKDSSKKSDDKPKVTSKLPKLGLYVALINQVGSSYRNLSNMNSERYNQIRNQGEKPSIQWTSGIEIGIQKSKFQINTGIQTTTQTWTTSYHYTYRIFDSLAVWAPGHTYIKGYLLSRGRDTTMNQESVIKIQKVQIPFEYNQIIKVSDKTRIIAGAGLVLGWNVKTTGSMLLNPANMQLYNYSALKDKERTFNASPSINIGVQNSLSSNFMLQTSVFGNMSMYSRFKDDFNVKDYPYSLGINIKLLYMIK